MNISAAKTNGYNLHTGSGLLAKRRAKPHFTHRFNGDGLTKLVGGCRGKYFKHFHIRNRSVKITAEDIAAETEKEDVPAKLMVVFVANSDSIINLDNSLKEMENLVAFLKKNKTLRVTLTGNTGTRPDDMASPVGDGKKVMNYPAKLNGVEVITSELMIARAQAVKKILTDEFNIGSDRIKTRAGLQSRGEEGRNVGVEIMK
jgi:hypothetical protein